MLFLALSCVTVRLHWRWLYSFTSLDPWERFCVESTSGFDCLHPREGGLVPLSHNEVRFDIHLWSGEAMWAQHSYLRINLQFVELLLFMGCCSCRRHLWTLQPSCEVDDCPYFVGEETDSEGLNDSHKVTLLSGPESPRKWAMLVSSLVDFLHSV